MIFAEQNILDNPAAFDDGLSALHGKGIIGQEFGRRIKGLNIFYS